MALPIENTWLRQAALAYVIELYDELTTESGAPTLGTQNQAVDFILADAGRRDALSAWAVELPGDRATPTPPRRLPQDDLYRSVRVFLEGIMEPPMFAQAPHAGP